MWAALFVGQPINKTLPNAGHKPSENVSSLQKQQKTIKNKQKQIKSNHGGELLDCGTVETLRFNGSTVQRPGGPPPDKGNISMVIFERVIAERVKNARTAQGFSMSELARRVGVSVGVISRIESIGLRANPSINTVYTLARILGVSVDWLLGDGPDMQAELKKQLHGITAGLQDQLDIITECAIDILDEAATIKTQLGGKIEISNDMPGMQMQGGNPQRAQEASGEAEAGVHMRPVWVPVYRMQGPTNSKTAGSN